MIPVLPLVVVGGVGIGAWLMSRRKKRKTMKLVDIAKSYIGTNEEPRGSNRGPVVDQFTGGNALPWCAYFVSFVIRKAGLGSATIASVNGIADRAAAAGVWSEDPSIGAVLVMLSVDDLSGPDADTDHAGIVVGINADGLIVSVEGNYSNGVRLVTRNRDEISGFIAHNDISKVWGQP